MTQIEELNTTADPSCYDTGFTTLPNQIHDNKNLEVLAKMLYWHLERYRTCPGWKTHDSEVRRFLDCGIKVLQRLFRQLTDEGFISYTITHKNGRIASKVRHFSPLPIHKGKKKFKTLNYNVDSFCPDSNNPDSNNPVLTNTNPLPNTKSNNNGKSVPARPVVVDEQEPVEEVGVPWAAERHFLDIELANVGITDGNRRAWISAYGHQPARIRNAIRTLMEAKDVKKPNAFLREALEKAWEPEPEQDLEYNRIQSQLNQTRNLIGVL